MDINFSTKYIEQKLFSELTLGETQSILKEILVWEFLRRNISLTDENYSIIMQELCDLVLKSKYIKPVTVSTALRKYIDSKEFNLSAERICSAIKLMLADEIHIKAVKHNEQKSILKLESPVITEEQQLKAAHEAIDRIKEYYFEKGIIMLTISEESWNVLKKNGYFEYYTKDIILEMAKKAAIEIKQEYESSLLSKYDHSIKHELAEFVLKISEAGNDIKTLTSIPKLKLKLRSNILKDIFEFEIKTV